MARNRYGWQKRSKEIARKEKNDEKMKRRQGKIIAAPAEDLPEAMLDDGLDVGLDVNLDETDPVGESLQQGS